MFMQSIAVAATVMGFILTLRMGWGLADVDPKEDFWWVMALLILIVALVSSFVATWGLRYLHLLPVG